jgi:hypothetical protein
MFEVLLERRKGFRISINLSRGGRLEARCSIEAALRAAREWGWVGAVFLDVRKMNGTAGDHEGPPNPASSTLAPTNIAGLFFG